MNETIFQNHGTIDKFIGDAIMVLFGPRVDVLRRAGSKCYPLCSGDAGGMAEVNANGKAKALLRSPSHWHLKKAVVGTGSPQRRLYGGWAKVNLASRIESACVPGEILSRLRSASSEP